MPSKAIRMARAVAKPPRVPSEIIAIAKRLETLVVGGGIITIDAMDASAISLRWS